MALQGTLDTFALPDVLRLLAATKKTGRLRITGGRGTGSVWVVGGEVTDIEATHAPHAGEDVHALFELLRFQEGAFTFDAEATHDAAGAPTDVEILLQHAEALLLEWQEIEAVVPSLDAWVTLSPTLPAPEVTLAQEHWTSLVAVGSGATVRRVGDELCLAELPVSRAIKVLVEAGMVDVAPSAPAGAGAAPAEAAVAAPAAPPPAARPEPTTLAPLAPPPAPVAAVAPAAVAPPPAPPAPPADPEVFVPLDLPGQGAPASYDKEEPAPLEVDEIAAAFPGLANRLTAGAPEEADPELAAQLATLSPRAAEAVRAAAAATTDEEREAALDDAEGEDDSVNRGMLLKFLSSVKS